jgi:hypothetical protein
MKTNELIRLKTIAKKLYKLHKNEGIWGRTAPENLEPKGISKFDYTLFITLTVSIDYQRDADDLWNSARKTYMDASTKYLFNPKLISETGLKKIANDMQKYNLSKKPDRDSKIWQRIGITLNSKYKGDPLNFFQTANYDAINILARLQYDYYFDKDKKRQKPDFPNLRGPKIAPLWLRILKYQVGVQEIQNLDKVPVPVDIHVARASLSLGVVRGNFQGDLNIKFDEIRNNWFKIVKDIKIDNRDMISLDVDEPLWILSKEGCSNCRDSRTLERAKFKVCPFNRYCLEGKIVIEKNNLQLKT